MFKPVDPKVNFVELERHWLSWWEEKGLVEKYLSKNRNSSKRFSFIDGPITANNQMGVHHAWGRMYKDLWQRYKNMQGFRQRFQNGFDCQGLWVEVEVEKDLGFNSKKDIEKFGLENFSKACRERVEKYSKIQANQSKRLGYFMDWDNSYYTYTDKNIEYIWYFLKECYKKGWLYKGFRSLPWCARCGTSLSQHELSDSYEEMTHESVFFKLSLVNKNKEYFLVWTTTPWTLAANVALAVNPNLTYTRVKVGDEILILAKDLLKILKEKYQIVDEVRGSKLDGLKYKGPFDELPVQKKSQRVVLLWDDVSGTEGTGIVHIAPGCGEEDFELGKKHNLTVIVPLDENGIYVEGYSELSGKFGQQVNNLVFASLKKKGFFYKIEDHTHSYPICWRCKEPIVFRAEENWFISASEIRPKMLREAGKVKWHPEFAGKLMENWLKNMGDWNISRKRYFGLPLPFYECQCGEKIIIGSREELRKLAIVPQKVDDLPELHRPWIDEIKIKCPKCHETVDRIPDIGDCWLDAGIVPFSTLKYLEDKKYWQEWFPADWISEMREQVRLWFYSTLFMAVTLEDRTPYLEVLSYEKLNDEKGRPMHKSAGNTIWFDEAAEKMGVDVVRWMYATQNPELNLNFGYHIADETRRRFHLMLWNVYNFFVAYANLDKLEIRKLVPSLSRDLKLEIKNILDRWILSRLNTLIKEVTDSLENYDAYSASWAIEEFVSDLSTWYIRRSRERVGLVASGTIDKKSFYLTTYRVLLSLAKILAPFTPFLAEEIFKNLSDEAHLASAEASAKSRRESVHLQDWPEVDESAVNLELEKEMAFVRQIVEIGHAKRKKAGIKVRQPLNKFSIFIRQSADQFSTSDELIDLIKDELNVKEVEITEGEGEMRAELDTKITLELEQEGEAREIVRKIQEERKKANCGLRDKIEIGLPSWPEKFEEEIKKKTLTERLYRSEKLVIKSITGKESP